MSAAHPEARPSTAAADVLPSFIDDLAAWRPTAPHLRMLRKEYLDFLESGGSAERASGPQHLTASAFVLSPDLSRVLLTFHRKGQFWVQLGGHVETEDVSMSAAAQREALEEGGIDGLRLLRPLPVDLDRHGLGDGFGRCSVHWDVGYVLLGDGTPVTSEESEDVAWWPVDALPEQVPAGFSARLSTVLAEVAATATFRLLRA